MLLIVSLIFLNTESNWTLFLAYIYIQVICFSSIIISAVVAVFFIISVCEWFKSKNITRVQSIRRIEENQPSIDNIAEIQNSGSSQRITEKKEESKEEEKFEKPENDLKPQDLDDSFNIDDIHHKI